MSVTTTMLQECKIKIFRSASGRFRGRYNIVPKCVTPLMQKKMLRHPNTPALSTRIPFYYPVKRQEFCIASALIIMFSYIRFIHKRESGSLSHNYIMIVCRPGVARLSANETIFFFCSCNLLNISPVCGVTR